MTLADLRTLLTRAHGPAVERVPRPTIDRLGYRYLTRSIWLVEKDGSPEGVPINHAGISLAHERWPDRGLDLTDPGTVHAVKVALALALGLDPGVMGIDCIWRRLFTGAWHMACLGSTAYFHADHIARDQPMVRDLVAPEVAAESDDIKALVLACQRVIREKA